MNIIKKKAGVFIIIIWLLSGAIIDLYPIAWGTGSFLGGFSLRWGLGFAFFSTFLIFLLIIIWFALWRLDALQPSIKRIVSFRQKLGFLRWGFAFLLIILPIYFFQYTFWGLVFRSVYFKLFIWILLNTFLAILFTQEEKKLITWYPLLYSILLTGTSYTLAGIFSHASNYPFNLFWSDGNRLWDYSLIFGKKLYNYPLDQEIPSLTSKGRQVLWGIPFLLPNSTIFLNRLWSAILFSVPYLLLGWVTFKNKEIKGKELVFVSLWALLFLNQGPIYTPLILSAILVAIAWERPLWIALPLVALAGYYAEITRWTWMFASAIWAGVLSINGSKLKGVRLSLRDWGRAIALALSGVSAWYLLSLIQKESVVNEQGVAFDQALLWYRLLPNDTYPEGILGGLLIAVLPLAILLVYIATKKYWQPSLWQKLAILGSLFVFLIVGLTISTKIGGGNNLHNLDMFLIMLFFVTAIAWKNGGNQWFEKTKESPLWVKIVLILLLALPAFPFVRGIAPKLALTPNETTQVEILTDYDEFTDPPIQSLPSADEVQIAMDRISSVAEFADKQDEVLFIDLRQFLTFGYVPKIKLVPEYEKKKMMNEAMANSTDYFESYYQDLANHRFSLIITEPLKLDIKNEEGSFAEEGDAWTYWVAAPTLCFYEPIDTFKSVYAQLLIPRREPLDCSAYLK